MFRKDNVASCKDISETRSLSILMKNLQRGQERKNIEKIEIKIITMSTKDHIRSKGLEITLIMRSPYKK